MLMYMKVAIKNSNLEVLQQNSIFFNISARLQPTSRRSAAESVAAAVPGSLCRMSPVECSLSHIKPEFSKMCNHEA